MSDSNYSQSESPQQDGPSDEELVEQLRKGDREAMEILSQRWWPAIYRFCAYYLEDDALGEDVTQETFAKLLDGTELPTGRFKPWLYKVARNRCLDIHRRRSRFLRRLCAANQPRESPTVQV